MSKKQVFESCVFQVRKFDELLADGGFTCLPESAVVKVDEDEHGFFVPCADGKHYLAGQLNERGDKYVGFLNNTRDEAF